MAKKKAKKKVAKKKPAKKAAKKKVAKKKASNKEVLVVASKVKAHIRSNGCMCSAEAIGAINEALYECLDKAIARTGANRRSTVRAQDF